MSSASQPPIQIGEIIAGKYRTERVLGMGAMGVVVEATNIALQQRVALKFLLSARGAGDAVHERFLREARAAARLRSEHVARVTDVGILDTGAPYMVMELLEGRDLAAELEERGQLPVSEACDYLLQACEAIAEAHAAGIVHRDLKPSNLFLSRDVTGRGHVKVFDFGVSKVADAGAKLTAAGQSVGSPLYMSPEQTRGQLDVDGRADIWSLGVILYELVTGRTPFYADTLLDLMMNIVNHPYVPLRTYLQNVPPDFEIIVALCLDKDRERRCPDIVTLAGMLATFAPPPPAAGARVTATGNRKVSSSPALPVLPSVTPAGALPGAAQVLGAAPLADSRGSYPSSTPLVPFGGAGTMPPAVAVTSGGTTSSGHVPATPNRSRLPLGLALGALAIAGAVGATYMVMSPHPPTPASAASVATPEVATPPPSVAPAPTEAAPVASTPPTVEPAAAPITSATATPVVSATAAPIATAAAPASGPAHVLRTTPATPASPRPAAPRPDLYGGRK